jgi:hypothetical protein
MNTSAVSAADRTPGGVCPATAHAGPPTARSTPTHLRRDGPHRATVGALGEPTAAAPHRTVRSVDVLTGERRSAGARSRVVARRADGTSRVRACRSGAGRRRLTGPPHGAPAEVRAGCRRFLPSREARS